VEWLLLRVAVPPATAEPLADFLVAEGAPAVVRETEGVAPDRVVVEAHVPASAHTRVAAALAGYLAGTGDVAIESAPLADVDCELLLDEPQPAASEAMSANAMARFCLMATTYGPSARSASARVLNRHRPSGRSSAHPY